MEMSFPVAPRIAEKEDCPYFFKLLDIYMAMYNIVLAQAMKWWLRSTSAATSIREGDQAE